MDTSGELKLTKLIIVDDDKRPLRILLSRTSSIFCEVSGWFVSKYFQLENASMLSDREAVVAAFNSLVDGDTTVFSDLVWEHIQTIDDWRCLENPVRKAVVSFLKRDSTNRFIIYTSNAPGPQIAELIAKQSKTIGQCICLEQLSAGPKTETDAENLIAKLENEFGVFRCSELSGLWKNGKTGQLFTKGTPEVPHTFNTNATQGEIDSYLKWLTNALDLGSIGEIPEQYYCEAFHESLKSLFGGVAIMNDGSGLPLTLGGVLGLAFLAFTRARNVYPEWKMPSNAKALLNRPFVAKRNGLSSKHENRQCASLIHNAFEEWFRYDVNKSEQDPRKLTLESVDDGVKISLGWNVLQNHESLTRKAGNLFNSPSCFKDIQNSACAYVHLSRWLDGHPGSIAINESVLSITAEQD